MGVLAVAFVALGALEDPSSPNLANRAVAILAGLFFAEFLLRCLDDPHPIGYLRGHWIDLATCIPAVGPLRLLRLLRLLRVFNAAAVIRRLATERGDASSSPGLRLLVSTLFAFWLVAGIAFYLTEANQPHSAVHSFTDALFLAFTTATSVGSSPLKPVTFEGQVVAGLVIFMGLGLLAAASSRLTSLWIDDSAEQELKDVLHDVRDRLGETEARLNSIEIALRGSTKNSASATTADVEPELLPADQTTERLRP